MANFPGSQNALPDVYAEVVTESRGVSVPGGIRLAAIVGEGSRVERLVNSANGSGKDGLNSTFTSSTNSDGRHFKLSVFPIISNRTVLFKNGIPLTGIEQTLATTFSANYDYEIEIATGKIILQGAALVDQGGSFYSASSTNVGNGVINALSLSDVNAPTETWTIRCTSVHRDTLGNPIDGYGKFIAQGSVSGTLLDGYGNQIVWQTNDIVNTNGILTFSIDDGSTPFVEGDKFTIKVKGGALTRSDSLVAHYIGEIDINDPEFFTDLDSLNVKHGAASLDNRLSLGAQLAFANVPPGVWAVQAAPSIPRRLSYLLQDSASGNAQINDLEFRLPLNIDPDSDTNIHFFVTDPVTLTETQIIPNKVPFYDSAFTISPTSFVFGNKYSFSYTVILDPLYENIFSDDHGSLTRLTATTATFSSTAYTFTLADAVSSRRIEILTPDANAGIFTVVSVTNGNALISRTTGSFVTDTSTTIHFNVLDTTSSGAVVLFTHDLALGAGQKLRATIVDTKDASFFDVGWINAFESLEKIECDIVVPLPAQTISSVFASARAHVETMSNIKNRHERVLFIGAISGLTPDNVIGTTQAAVEDLGILEGIQGDDTTEILAGNIEDLTDYGVQNSFGNTFRVVYFYPDQIVVQIGSDQTKVDGFFIAAAAAGFLSSIPNVAIPLTNKVLAGFTILRDKIFRPVILENVAAAGLSILQPATGGGLVKWGRTTTISGFPEEEEISIVFIRDRVAKTMRAGFRAFIGAAESPSFQNSLMARANSILTGLVAQGLITAFKDLKVARDSVDPRQFNISVRVQPTYPINWIYIKIGLGVL